MENDSLPEQKKFSPLQQELLLISQKYYELDKQETIINVLQRNYLSYYIPRFVRGAIFLLIYTLLRFLIFSKWNQTSGLFVTIANWILIVWAVYFGISMIVGIYFVKGHIFIITDHRIILIRKFLGILYREIEFKRITDLVLHQPLFGRIFNYGNLMPVTAGVEMGSVRMGIYSIEGISNVFTVRNVVIAQIQRIQSLLLEKLNAKPSNETDDSPQSKSPDSTGDFQIK